MWKTVSLSPSGDSISTGPAAPMLIADYFSVSSSAVSQMLEPGEMPAKDLDIAY
jgi:hypothetical protein